VAELFLDQNDSSVIPMDDLEVTLLNEATQLTMQVDFLAYCVLKEDVAVIVPHCFV
jgi:hypothetical protein